MTLSNQELINELQKRIKENVLEAPVITGKAQTTSRSLLSHLEGKNLLFIVGLTLGFTLLVCYSISITSSKVTEIKIEFENSPPTIINLTTDKS